MGKQNCWEFMRCGRQPGGEKIHQQGECPTVRSFAAHGLNHGINGGRSCWVIAGTYCNGEVQGTFVNKIRGCAACDFFHHVHAEEEAQLVTTPELMNRIHADRQTK